MIGFDLQFHHLGLAVRTPEKAVSFLSGLGYTIGNEIFDPEQNVNLIMCHHEQMPDVEIIFAGVGEGPIDRYTKRHSRGIIYHACFITDARIAALSLMKEAGLRPLCISKPRPGILFENKPVSFYNVLGIGLIEIIER